MSPDEVSWSRLRLNPRLQFAWTNDSTRIHFDVVAETVGWLGFGFSKTLPSLETDGVIFAIDGKGTVTLADCHTEKGSGLLPKLVADVHTDYVIQNSSHNATYLSIRFNRALDTGDKGDYKITVSALKIF